MQLNCPDDQIKDKESCTKLREKLSKGFGQFGHFGPPHSHFPPPPAASDSEE